MLQIVGGHKKREQAEKEEGLLRQAEGRAGIHGRICVINYNKSMFNLHMDLLRALKYVFSLFYF